MTEEGGQQGIKDTTEWQNTIKVKDKRRQKSKTNTIRVKDKLQKVDRGGQQTRQIKYTTEPMTKDYKMQRQI